MNVLRKEHFPSLCIYCTAPFILLPCKRSTFSNEAFKCNPLLEMTFPLGLKKWNVMTKKKFRFVQSNKPWGGILQTTDTRFQTTKDTKTKRNRTQRRAEMNDSPRDVYQCINHREKRSNTNAHGLKLKRKLNESKSPWWRKLICGKEGVTVRELMFRAVTDAERRRIVRRCLWTATANRPSCLFFKRLKRAASAGVLIKNILKSKQSELRPTERCDVD